MNNYPRDKGDVCCRCSVFYTCCSCYDCTDFDSCEQCGTLMHNCSPCRRFSPTIDFAIEKKLCRSNLTAYLWYVGN